MLILASRYLASLCLNKNIKINMKKIKNFNSFNLNENKWISDKGDYTDYYFVYNLDESEIQEYLNVWSQGLVRKGMNNKIYTDEIITLKKCDEETASHLYRIVYNPVSLRIMCPTGAKFKQNEKGEDLYEMKVKIHSIDNSSYGIWWSYYMDNCKPLHELLGIRDKIKKWLDAQDELNGEKFLEYCETLGASDRDYN